MFYTKGDIKSLPKATSLDFFWNRYSRGTRVNGKLVPLNYELKMVTK
jgi:GTP pyrophosphokinase